MCRVRCNLAINNTLYGNSALHSSPTSMVSGLTNSACLARRSPRCRHPPPPLHRADSIMLDDVSEEAFISNVKLRYSHDRIYTYIGEVSRASTYAPRSPLFFPLSRPGASCLGLVARPVLQRISPARDRPQNARGQRPRAARHPHAEPRLYARRAPRC